MYGVTADDIIEVLSERVIYFCASFGNEVSTSDIFVDNIDCNKDDGMIWVSFRIKGDDNSFHWCFKK